MLEVLLILICMKNGSVAEWSKALVLGTSPSRRGFESHHYQIFIDRKKHITMQDYFQITMHYFEVILTVFKIYPHNHEIG